MTFGAGAMPTVDQAAIILLLVALMVVLALDRFRIELVAFGGLAIGFAIGLVPTKGVFAGLSDPAVITVAEILIIIQALARSRVVERLSGQVTRLVHGEMAALAFLCGVSGFLSVFMNNIGALALILPVAVSLSTQLGLPIRRTLMPVSFATLLGGLCSIIGTPANLVVSQARAELVGRAFPFFDLAWVGAPVAILGIAFLIVWGPRKLAIRQRASAGEQGIRQRRLVTELRLPAASPFAGEPTARLEEAVNATIHSVVREGEHVFARPGEQILRARDILVIEVATETWESTIKAGVLELVHPEEAPVGKEKPADVVVMPQSIFVGSRVGTLEPLERLGIAVIGVVPQRPRIEGRLADMPLGIGDVLVLSGPEDAIAEVLDEADLLRLSSRNSPPTKEASYTALSVFAAGVAVAAFGLIPPEIAFGLVVLILATTGEIRLREALQSLNWPILVLLAAMIPLGVAVETTGAARTMAHALLDVVPGGEPVVVVGCMLLIAVLLTPFVNNITTAVVLSPIAVEVAHETGVSADPLLIAVALGASLDFLTPFGHHNNTLVMGIAGYRFSDFPRLGIPLLAVTFAVGLFALTVFWL